MAIQQTAIEVPAFVQAGICSGELLKNGSVVRDTAGKIIKHLDEVPLDLGQAQELGAAIDVAAKKTLDAAKNNALPALVLGGVAFVTVSAAVVVTAKAKRAKAAKIQERAAIEDRFNVAATNWIKAASQGSLTTEIVAEMEAAWNAYSASNKEWKTQPNDLSVSLMRMMKNWNTRNGLEKKLPATTDSTTDATVVDLSEYLAAQHEMLSETA
ncbi:hypothetical protein [Corynebacterium flavescens]|uniref:hypothetical protein n=1 Tax=Corynebacterium flavescens TaxID=28028 RepID=UPI000EC276ED|nr:hypothetical protein [Corynebacterium flavescens]